MLYLTTAMLFLIAIVYVGISYGFMMSAAVLAGLGVVLVVLLLLIRWQWRGKTDQTPCIPSQLVHRLCPHHNVVQCYQVEEKDSLDEHLDGLTKKLAEKEGRLRLSKYKIRQTQNEIENLHAIDHDVRIKYREIMDALRNDLLSNEKECKKLQEQIEWVSRRRAELKDEVRRGQRLYGEAAAELANNLSEVQRGRDLEHPQRVTDKPQGMASVTSLRHRKEPLLPRVSPVGSIVIKNPPIIPSRLSRVDIQYNNI